MKIYHYTTIETLALILKNKTIRFSRLDILNDLEEGHISSSGVDVGKLAFVSCWTENTEEGIPLWTNYGKGCMGVRIALEKDMFKDYEWSEEHFKQNNTLRIPIYANGTFGKFKIPFKDIMTKGYTMYPPTKIEDFYFPIQYVKDMKSFVGKSVSTNLNQIENINNTMIGRYKHNRWEFEKEARFILYKYPIDTEEYLRNPSAETLSNRFINNHFDNCTFYDMHLKDDIFDSLEVILSPSANECHKIIVESLLKQYAPSAIWKESKLSNLVELK